MDWKMPLVAEQALLGLSTARIYQSIRVEMALQPEEADGVVEDLGKRKVNHAVTRPHAAQWLHMSLCGLSLGRWDGRDCDRLPGRCRPS